MLTRQDSLLSASRRQATAVAAATPPPSNTHHAKTIGCMSGIFQLFSRYQYPNKRLTSGRKREKNQKTKSSSPTKSKKTHPPAAKENKTELQAFDDTKRSTPARIPTLPPEIKPDDPRTPPPAPLSLVARLMGMEDSGGSSKKSPVDEEARLTEKRRQIMESLKKCNEDLEALKRIIEAVKTKEVTRSTTGVTHVQRMSVAAKKPGEDYEAITKLNYKSTDVESLLRMRNLAATPTNCSLAMVKSVEEVCSDIAWGEKREIGKIGLVLQDQICRDLIEELVKELKPVCSIKSFPFDACKRRLCF